MPGCFISISNAKIYFPIIMVWSCYQYNLSFVILQELNPLLSLSPIISIELHPFDSIKDLIYNLGNFLFEYNHLRRHEGIDYQTPYEKLEKVTELLR